MREKDADEQREKLRNKERLTRKELDMTVYDISLKLADQPGLPSPVAKTNAVAAKISGSTVPKTDEDEADEEKPPAQDTALLEAQQILVDYIGLMAKRSVAAATPAK